jgi:hypothetical protein
MKFFTWLRSLFTVPVVYDEAESNDEFWPIAPVHTEVGGLPVDSAGKDGKDEQL